MVNGKWLRETLAIYDLRFTIYYLPFTTYRFESRLPDAMRYCAMTSARSNFSGSTVRWVLRT